MGIVRSVFLGLTPQAMCCRASGTNDMRNFKAYASGCDYINRLLYLWVNSSLCTVSMISVFRPNFPGSARFKMESIISASPGSV